MTERREKEGGVRTDGEIGRQGERHRVTEGGSRMGGTEEERVTGWDGGWEG